MFSFLNPKKNILEANVLAGMTDVHCHLLPGVDDGVANLEEAHRALDFMESLGVRRIFLTPHIMEDIPNPTARLRERFAELLAAYKGNVVLNLAAENMLDKLFEERLEQGDLLPLGKDGRHLLVETSYFNPPMGLDDILRRIQAKGYYPLLAHPERYIYMEENDYARLKSMHIKFQLNLFSLMDLYGKEVRKRAKELQSKGMYDYIGTDLHRIAVLNNLLEKRNPSDSWRLLGE